MYKRKFSLYSQIDVSGNRKAVVIHVPYRLRKAFRKIHLRLVRELEKKFSGKVSFAFLVFGTVVSCLRVQICCSAFCDDHTIFNASMYVTDLIKGG